MTDIESSELSDGSLIIEKTDRTASVIEFLMNQQLVSDTHRWCGREFAIADGHLIRMLKGEATTIPFISDNAAQLGAAICVLIHRAEIGNWELDLQTISLKGFRPKYLVFDQCSIECLRVTHGPNPYARILANETRINLLQASRDSFQFSSFFENHTNLSVNAIVHHGRDNPLREGDIRDFELSSANVGYVYTDASRVSMNDLQHLQAIVHPQSTEANFFLKSVSFSFDLKRLQSELMWKSEIKPAKSWWKRYFANPAITTDARWQRVDLSLATNAALAESTVKVLYERSSLRISSEDYSRYLYYLNSRPSKLRRLLYWFNGAYYNIRVPFIFAAIFLGGMILSLSCGKKPVSDMFMIIDPKHLINNYLFHDLSTTHAIDFSKYAFVLCLLPFYYSLFCLGLALKRKFGFPNELK